MKISYANRRFADEFLAATTANPFNNRERIFGCVALSLLLRNSQHVAIHLIRALVKQNGHGTATLRWLCWLADKHGVTLVGMIEPTGRRPRLNRRQLKRWYAAHGFVVRKDWSMRREPLTAASRSRTCVRDESARLDVRLPSAPFSFPPLHPTRSLPRNRELATARPERSASSTA